MAPDRKRFLIVKLSSLGDVVHTLPVLRTLRTAYPEAFIAWIVEEKSQDVLYKNPDLDELIVVRTKHWRRNRNLDSLREIREAFCRLRNHRFEYVFDFQGLIKSGVFAWLSGAPNRLGFHCKDCRERLNALFTNHKAPFSGKNIHVIDKNLALLTRVEQERSIPDLPKTFPLAIPDAANEYIQDFLKDNPELTGKPIIGINPGVGFKTKQWDLKRFAELADRISLEMGFNILLTWGPGEEEKIGEITKTMTQRAWPAPATSIHQSIALYRQLSLFISCDTGPLHLCAALGIPTVSIFGPTDPVRNGPYGDVHKVVYKKLPCSFCYKRRCPTQNECMDQVTVEDLLEQVKISIATHIKVLAT